MFRRWVCLTWALSLLFCGTVSSEQDHDDSMKEALRILMRVPSGRALIERAKSHWSLQDPFDLLKNFRWAEVSKTDAVITRVLNSKTGQETRERKVTVLLRQEQKLSDLVLDLAHELVHATAQASWDPYDPELTPIRYIRAVIEAQGGEVDAVLLECQVAFELRAMGERLKSQSTDRCDSYLHPESNTLDRERILKDFYRVGHWNDELVGSLGSEVRSFRLLSSERPRLYSSTGHAPYPVALLREYEGIIEAACENSRKRLSAREERRGPASQPSSSPGSSPSSSKESFHQAARLFVERRCRE